MGLRGLTADALTLGRYSRALRRYLSSPLDRDEAIARISGRLAERDGRFLELAERTIYENARSPYRRLLEHAGVELGDLRRLVRTKGLEGALGRLRDEGVYVRIEELRGTVPIKRGSLVLHAEEGDFDSPIIRQEFETSTGGTRSRGRRLPLSLKYFEAEAS